MGTPAKKEFGPGYDYPNRKFHILAVILPTILIVALAVVLVRREGAPSSKVVNTPIVACPTQTCPPPSSTEPSSTAPASPAQAAKKTSSSSAGPAATLVLNVTGAMLNRASSAVTHAVILSSA
jgi:hypothetical protein